MRTMFSPLVFSQIRSLVAQGLSAAEIAQRIGCKLGSLRVKCSQRGISLRQASAARSESQFQKRLTISLPENVTLDLQKQADKKGVSEADLVLDLLSAIARDNLYDAVIDSDVRSRKYKTSRGPRQSKTGSD
jgi:hypothetical protein